MNTLGSIKEKTADKQMTYRDQNEIRMGTAFPSVGFYSCSASNKTILMMLLKITGSYRKQAQNVSRQLF